MSFFINLAPIDPATGSVMASSNTVSTDWPCLNGFRYDPADGSLAVLDGVPPAGAPYIGGLRLSPEGALYIWSFETDGTPASVSWAGGLPTTYDGRLIVTSELPTHWVAGWPIAANEWVSMNGGVVPPVEVTFDNIRIVFNNNAEPLAFFMNDLRFGSSGSVAGAYTNLALFLTEHPGLTLQTFDGIAPPGGNEPLPSLFTGFSTSSVGSLTLTEVWDAAFGGNPYGVDVVAMFMNDAYLEFSFAPVVNSAGFNWDGQADDIQFRDGTTILHSTGPVVGGSTLSQFIGYSTASGPPPATGYYIQETNTDKYQQETNTDVYIQE